MCYHFCKNELTWWGICLKNVLWEPLWVHTWHLTLLTGEVSSLASMDCRCLKRRLVLKLLLEMQSWVSNCREFASTVNSCDSCGALYCRFSSPHCSSICSCIWTTKGTSAWGTHWPCWMSVTSSWSHWPLPNTSWHKAYNAWRAGGRLVLESCSLKTVGQIVIFTLIWTMFSWTNLGFCNLCHKNNCLTFPCLCHDYFVLCLLFLIGYSNKMYFLKISKTLQCLSSKLL